MEWLTQLSNALTDPSKYIDALTLGAIYALIAVGYTMVYGIIKLINFAHGEIIMFGTYMGLLAVTQFNLPISLAIFLAMLGCAVLGMAVDWSAYLPLRRTLPLPDWLSLIGIVAFAVLSIVYFTRGRGTDHETLYIIGLGVTALLLVVSAILDALGAFGPPRRSVETNRLSALITAIGMSLCLQTIAQLLWTPDYRSFPESRPATSSSALNDLTVNEAAYTDGDVIIIRLNTNGQGQMAKFIYGQGGNGTTLGDLIRFLNGRNPGPHGSEIKFQGLHFALNERGTVEVEGELSGGDLLISDGQQKQDGSPQQGRSQFQLNFLQEIRLPRFFNRALLTIRGKPHLLGKELLTWIAALVLMVVLTILVNYSRIGRAMRACAIDKQTASLMGVNVNHIIAFTFMIGSAMAAVAGLLYAIKVGGNISPRMGYYPGVIAFAAAVLGGIGNIRGALLGGLLIGFTQAFGGSIRSEYDMAFAFGLMVLFIMFRPWGILGQPESKRA